MKKLFLLFAVCLPVSLLAQNVIIKQDVNKDFEDNEFGPNKKFYNSTFTGFGFLFGPTDKPGSDINWYRSFYYENGRRHKRQFGPFFALGHEASVNLRSFSIRQDSAKTFGGQIQHTAERFFQINGNLTIYTRFNFSRHRGNRLGRYLDLGGYAEYAIISRHMIRDKIDKQNGYTQGKTYLRGLQYINRLNYGATARIGFGHIAFFGTYRLSDIFIKSEQFNYEELPRFSAGISFDIPE